MILKRVDSSGVFALPDGITADKIKAVTCDGTPVLYSVINGGTEIDVIYYTEGSVVELELK